MTSKEKIFFFGVVMDIIGIVFYMLSVLPSRRKRCALSL